jgi:predicted outer membrane repeat protein
MLRLLGGVMAAYAVGTRAEGDAGARKKVHAEHNRRAGGKKTILCYQGETIRKPTSQRKKWLKRGATRGKCAGTCTPSCPTNGTCGMDDGCGGICGCTTGTVCAAGVCESCTVSCTGEPAACGKELTVAIEQGGNIYLCPGTYQGNFVTSSDVNIYGAGSGSDPTTNSVLDGGTTGATLIIEEEYTTILSGLYITNGRTKGSGGGVYATYGTTVTIENCTITGNEANLYAGGLYLNGDAATLRNTTISGNTAVVNDGGGVYSSGSDATIENCLITGNTAANGGGGGFDGGTVTFTATAFSSNTAKNDGGGLYLEAGNYTFDSASSVINNIATAGGGIFGDTSNVPTVNLNGATVSGNTGGNCGGSVSC